LETGFLRAKSYKVLYCVTQHNMLCN